MKHKELFSLDYGIAAEVVIFSPYEHLIIDQRLQLPEGNPGQLAIQRGLPSIQGDIVYSPPAVVEAENRNQELLDAVRLELRHIARR